jgi:hypothetical protein
MKIIARLKKKNSLNIPVLGSFMFVVLILVLPVALSLISAFKAEKLTFFSEVHILLFFLIPIIPGIVATKKTPVSFVGTKFSLFLYIYFVSILSLIFCYLITFIWIYYFYINSNITYHYLSEFVVNLIYETMFFQIFIFCGSILTWVMIHQIKNRARF